MCTYFYEEAKKEVKEHEDTRAEKQVEVAKPDEMSLEMMDSLRIDGDGNVGSSTDAAQVAEGSAQVGDIT